MAKDPAILFYAQDFLTGTMFMSNEQVGIYIRLLCAQHQHGGMIDKNSFNGMVKDDQMIRSKFIETDDGFFNERLMLEMNKRAKKSKNLSANAKARWEKYKTDAIALQKDVLIENENEDENNITTKQEGGTGETIKPPRLTHLDLFLQSTPDIESMVKYAKGIGKVLTVDRIKQLAASHDIQHKIAKPNGTYGQWRQYFMYFLSSHKEPFKPVNSEAPKYRLYTPPTE